MRSPCRGVAVLLLACWLLVLAAPARAGEELPLTFDMERAVERARRGSPLVELAEAMREQAELEWLQAQEQADRIPAESVETYEMASIKYLYPFQALMAYLVARQYEKAAACDAEWMARRTYCQLWQAQAALRAAEEAVEAAVAHLDFLNLAGATGTVTREDLLAGKVRVAQAQAQLVAAQGAVALAEEAFRQALGIHPERKIELSGLPEPASGAGAEGEDLAALTAEALDKRFEVYAAEKECEVRRLDLDLARRYPSTPLAPMPAEGLPPMEPDETPEEYWERLQDWLGEQAEAEPSPHAVPRAEAALRQSQLKREAAKDAVRLDVLSAYWAVQRARANLEAARAAAEAAAEALELARARYEAGTISRLELINAELEAVVAAVGEETARCELLMAEADLAHARGWGTGEGRPLQLTSGSPTP